MVNNVRTYLLALEAKGGAPTDLLNDWYVWNLRISSWRYRLARGKANSRSILTDVSARSLVDCFSVRPELWIKWRDTMMTTPISALPRLFEDVSAEFSLPISPTEIQQHD